jgi:hypothetical protein
MKFKSRKDILNTTVYWICFIGILVIIPFAWLDESENIAVKIFVTVLLTAVLGFLYSVFYRTYYEMNSKEILIQNGPIDGKVQIDSIHEIVSNTTMWVGFWKPATAMNGLIIKYNKFDELYISPETNEKFIEEILKINPEIKVTRK